MWVHLIKIHLIWLGTETVSKVKMPRTTCLLRYSKVGGITVVARFYIKIALRKIEGRDGGLLLEGSDWNPMAWISKFSSIQSLNHVQLFATPWMAACQASLSITSSWSLLKLMSIMLVMPSSHLILCRPLLLLPSILPSIRVFCNESTLRIRWPKYWSFSFSIIPSNEYSGLTSFRTDRLDLLAVQGTLKSLLQHHSSKASILWCSAFFTVHLSHPYMTTGKTIALTRQTFVGKIMSLLFNRLPRLVISFLPRSKHPLISCCSHCSQWFWSLAVCPVLSVLIGQYSAFCSLLSSWF